jgi:hypothetical protein
VVSHSFADRDAGEIEAFVVDRYLESLLARHPAPSEAVPAELRATADRLAAGLPRHHPSFRFEERLALRLAEAAAALRLPAAAGGEGVLVPFGTRPVPGPRPGEGDPVDAVETIELGTGRLAVDRPPAVRPVVLGGVLTSAALSLAGAAWVAWRRNRSGHHPMTRAVRALTRTRTA